MTELGDRNRRVPLRLRSGFRHAAQILRLRSGQALRKRLNLEWSMSFLPAWRLPAVVNLVEIFFPDNSPESPEERLRVADDGNFETSAEEERFLIDDAMVGGEH